MSDEQYFNNGSHANDRNDVTANSNNNAKKHAAIPIGDVTKKPVGRSNTFAATTNHNDPHNFHHFPITRTTGATTPARRSRPLRRRRKNSYNDEADDSDDGRLDDHNDHKNAPLISPNCIYTEREVADCEAFNDSQTAVSCDHDSSDNGELLSPLQTTKYAAADGISADVVVDEERKITFKSYNKSGKPPSKPSTPPSITSPSSSGNNVSVVYIKSDTSDATAAEFNILDEGILRCFNKKLVNESTNNKTINVDSSRVLNNGQFNDKRVSCSSENEALRSFDFIHAEYKEHAAVATEASNNYQHAGVVDDNNAAGSSDQQQEPIMVQNVVLLSDDANKNIDGFSQDLDVNEKCLSRQMLDCISVDAPDDGVILPSSLRASMNSRHRRFAKNGRLSSKSHQSGINPEFVGVIRVGSVREKSKNYNSVKDRDFFTKPIVETKSVSNLYDDNLNLCNNINVDCDANNHTKSQDNIFAAAVHADDKEVQKGVSVNTIAQMFDQHATNSHGRNIVHDTSCSSINCDVSKNNIGSNQTILDNGCPIPNAASTFLNGTTTDSSANKVGPNLTKAFPTTSTVSPQISKQSQQSATKNAEQSQQKSTATLSVVKRSSSLYAKNVSRGGNFNNQVEASTPISPQDKSPRKFPGKSLNEFNNKNTNIGNQTIVTGSKSPPSSTSLDHNNNITNAYKKTANAERRTGNSMKPHDDVNCNGSRFEAINRRSSTEVSSRSGGHNTNFTTNNKNIKRFDGYNNPATTNVSMSHGESTCNDLIGVDNLLQEYQKQQKEINHLKMLVEQKDLKIQKLEEELQKSKSKRYQAN
ncbi:hypothetical protein HELRODRAFT_166022 [Helobdella robusta]|uniref:Uncharacterized protein n=1 Tax=Helobdella robusta TaxID=6412 RepID=T1EXL9_HELRO|nr:hypothetical protein HELRODRAFT_166022 [Helobdella robusta]ESN90363.1 hypothetical protein HELRODRAFT_166022 [Helobdella robusta]